MDYKISILKGSLVEDAVLFDYTQVTLSHLNWSSRTASTTGFFV